MVNTRSSTQKCVSLGLEETTRRRRPTGELKQLKEGGRDNRGRGRVPRVENVVVVGCFPVLLGGIKVREGDVVVLVVVDEVPVWLSSIGITHTHIHAYTGT